MLILCGALYYWSTLESVTQAPIVTPKLITTFPHDTTSFTQGLLVEGSQLYESTGQYGSSSIRRVDLRTGKAQQIHKLDKAFFGEGLAALDGKLYQLTWKAQKAFVYDLTTFAPLDTLTIPAQEGWGLTENDTHLIMSDGSSTLRFLDPQTFDVVREIEVRNGEQPVKLLNELEYIEGMIYANIWQSGYAAVIDPQSGDVKVVLDLRWFSMVHAIDGADVLNGIAFEPTSRRLLVTGKLWPKLYILQIPEIAN